MIEKNCITQVSIPTVDNTQIECDEITSSKCVVVEEQCNKIGNLEGENLEQYLGRLCSKITSMDNKIILLTEDAETPNEPLNFIPLTGTEEGSPVTGKTDYNVFIEEEDTRYTDTIGEGLKHKVEYYAEGNVVYESSVNVFDGVIEFNSTDYRDNNGGSVTLGAEIQNGQDLYIYLPKESGSLLTQSVLEYNNGETDTKKTFLGKKVYRQVLSVDLTSGDLTMQYTNTQVESVLEFKGIYSINGDVYQKVFDMYDTLNSSNANTPLKCSSINFQNNQLILNGITSSATGDGVNPRINVILEYTKVTD